MVVKWANTISPSTPLANQHGAAGAIARGDGRLVVLDAQECRLLDEHVLARRERRKRQRQVKARRYGDDDRIDVGIFNRRGVVRVGAGAAEVLAEGIRLRPRPARITGDDVTPQRTQMPAVDARDESAAQERNPQGSQAVDQFTRPGFGVRDSGFVGSGFGVPGSGLGVCVSGPRFPRSRGPRVAASRSYACGRLRARPWRT